MKPIGYATLLLAILTASCAPTDRPLSVGFKRAFLKCSHTVLPVYRYAVCVCGLPVNEPKGWVEFPDAAPSWIYDEWSIVLTQETNPFVANVTPTPYASDSLQSIKCTFTYESFTYVGTFDIWVTGR